MIIDYLDFFILCVLPIILALPGGARELMSLNPPRNTDDWIYRWKVKGVKHFDAFHSYPPLVKLAPVLAFIWSPSPAWLQTLGAILYLWIYFQWRNLYMHALLPSVNNSPMTGERWFWWSVAVAGQVALGVHLL